MLQGITGRYINLKNFRMQRNQCRFFFGCLIRNQIKAYLNSFIIPYQSEGRWKSLIPIYGNQQNLACTENLVRRREINLIGKCNGQFGKGHQQPNEPKLDPYPIYYMQRCNLNVNIITNIGVLNIQKFVSTTVFLINHK